jgi:hypothetical protein
MITRTISIIAALVRQTAAAVGATALIAGLWLVVAPLTSHIAPVAVADGDGEGGGDDGGGDHDGGGADSGSDGGDDGGDDHSGPGDADDQGAEDEDEGAAAVNGDDRDDGDHYVAGEVVVANLSGEAEEDVRRLGFVVLDEQQLASLGLTVTRLRVPQRMTAPAARTLLAARFPKVVVDVNAVYRPQGQVILPAPGYPAKLIGWGQAPAACGQGLRIGVLDTAVDAVIPGLRGARIVQRSFLPSRAKPASTEHGTAIAEILVGQKAGGGDRGLLPGAELVVAGVFAADSAGIPAADVVALVAGLDWLAGSGAPVINMSFAGDANALVSLALQRVTAGRAIVVAAAGNGGGQAPSTFPAAEPGVIGVTAIDSRSQPYADSSRGDYVDFAAPGVRIWIPGPTAAGSYHTGTSFAAPFVTAAVAAQLASGAPTDPERIAQSLAESAVDLGAPGKDPVFGWGLIQLANPCSQPTQ